MVGRSGPAIDTGQGGQVEGRAGETWQRAVVAQIFINDRCFTLGRQRLQSRDDRIVFFWSDLPNDATKFGHQPEEETPEVERWAEQMMSERSTI